MNTRKTLLAATLFALPAVLCFTSAATATVQPAQAELIVYPILKTVRTPDAAGKLEADLNAVDLVDVVDGYQLAYLVKTRVADGATPRIAQ